MLLACPYHFPPLLTDKIKVLFYIWPFWKGLKDRFKIPVKATSSLLKNLFHEPPKVGKGVGLLVYR